MAVSSVSSWVSVSREASSQQVMSFHCKPHSIVIALTFPRFVTSVCAGAGGYSRIPNSRRRMPRMPRGARHTTIFTLSPPVTQARHAAGDQQKRHQKHQAPHRKHGGDQDAQSQPQRADPQKPASRRHIVARYIPPLLQYMKERTRRAWRAWRATRRCFLSFRASANTGVGIRLPKKEKRIAASLRTAKQVPFGCSSQ